MKNSHCSFCGEKFATLTWPRTCSNNHTSYDNPIPVVICLQPVRHDDGRKGLMIAQRAIPPNIGEWTLIAGHIENNGESVQKAGRREYNEETSTVMGDNVRIIDSIANGKGHLLLIVEADPIPYQAAREAKPCSENFAIDILWEPRDLGFPIHTDLARKWFERNGWVEGQGTYVPMTPGLLVSMAIRYDHGFGIHMGIFDHCDTLVDKQIKILNEVAGYLNSGLDNDPQLEEERTLRGFYRPSKEAVYCSDLDEGVLAYAVKLSEEYNERSTKEG